MVWRNSPHRLRDNLGKRRYSKAALLRELGEVKGESALHGNVGDQVKFRPARMA